MANSRASQRHAADDARFVFLKPSSKSVITDHIAALGCRHVHQGDEEIMSVQGMVDHLLHCHLSLQADMFVPLCHYGRQRRHLRFISV